MKDPQCKECQFFSQHYTLTETRLIRVYCGHCTFSRIKRKLPDSKVCGNFVPGHEPEEAFVSKEYLSKKLLQYVLQLELLPDLQNGE